MTSPDHGGAAPAPRRAGQPRPDRRRRAGRLRDGGIDATVEEIARRAGVGMGTLYRRFPTKEDLVDAVLEDAFGELVERGGGGRRGGADAWAGLTSFLERALAAARRGTAA